MVNHIQKKLCHEEDDEGSWDWIRVGFGRVWIRIGFGLDSDLDSDGIRIGLGVFCFGRFVANWAWEWQDLVETCGNHHFKSEMDSPGPVSCLFCDYVSWPVFRKVFKGVCKMVLKPRFSMFFFYRMVTFWCLCKGCAQRKDSRTELWTDVWFSRSPNEPPNRRPNCCPNCV